MSKSAQHRRLKQRKEFRRLHETEPNKFDEKWAAFLESKLHELMIPELFTRRFPLRVQNPKSSKAVFQEVKSALSLIEPQQVRDEIYSRACQNLEVGRLRGLVQPIYHEISPDELKRQARLRKIDEMIRMEPDGENEVQLLLCAGTGNPLHPDLPLSQAREIVHYLKTQSPKPFSPNCP